MPQKKENLPVKVDVDLQNGGTITYANEVIATIAGVAANEIDGIAGMCISGGFSEILSRNRNITRGVKVEVGSQEAAVDLYIIVEYGKPIQKVAGEVQENVRKALESLTGLHVVRVDVHVQGVSFEKEKKAAQTSIEAAKNPVLTASPAQVEEAAPAETKEAPAEEAAPQETAAEEAAPQEEAVEAAPDEEKAPEAADEIKEEEAAAEEGVFNEETLSEEAQLDEAPTEDAVPEAEAPAEEEPTPTQEAAPADEAEPTAGSSEEAKEPEKKAPAAKPGKRLGGRKRC